MDKLTSFEKIAPYLQNPLTLVGFALLLVFGTHRLLIKSGIIPQVTQQTGGAILKSLLRYGFIIAILIIVLGFVTAAIKDYNSKRVSLEKGPELYLSLSEKDETTWEYSGREGGPLKYPLESTIFEAFVPTFDDACALEPSTDIGELRSSRFVYLFNRGSKPVKKVWVRMFFDPHINVSAVGVEGWRYGYDESRDKGVLEYNGSDLAIKGQSVTSADVQLNFTVTDIPRTYKTTYVIGAEGIPLQERSFDIIVKADRVPYEFIEYERGRELLYEARDLAGALSHFKVAAKEAPRCGAPQFSAGTTLLQLNRADEALPYLQAATTLLKDDYRTWGNLALCYIKLHSLQDAKKANDRALELKPDSREDLINRHAIEVYLERETRDRGGQGTRMTAQGANASYRSGPSSFSTFVWINRGALFTNTKLVRVEMVNAGAFALEAYDPNGRLISTGYRENLHGGWSTFDFDTSISPAVHSGAFKLKLINKGSGNRQVKEVVVTPRAQMLPDPASK